MQQVVSALINGVHDNTLSLGLRSQAQDSMNLYLWRRLNIDQFKGSWTGYYPAREI